MTSPSPHSPLRIPQGMEYPVGNSLIIFIFTRFVQKDMQHHVLPRLMQYVMTVIAPKSVPHANQGMPAEETEGISVTLAQFPMVHWVR